MKDDELASRIVAHLDRDLADLPKPVVHKLQVARMAALAGQRSAHARMGRPKRESTGRWGFGLSTRLVVPAVIVIASLTGLIYWQMSSHPDEELDTGLLAGELPIHAYTDPGFETWLKHSNHEPSR